MIPKSGQDRNPLYSKDNRESNETDRGRMIPIVDPEA